MHNLRLQNTKKNETASSKTCPSQIKKEVERTSEIHEWSNAFLRFATSLEEFSFSNLAQCLSSKFYRLTNNLFGSLVNGFAFHSFPADSSWQQSSFDAESIGTVRNVAHLFGPSAPHSIATVESRVLGALKRLTHGRTSFYLSQ